METGMIIGVGIEAAVGLLCIVLGYLLWKKQKVSILHDYHYKNVKEEDIPAYARLMGIGLTLIGAGICLTGVLELLYSPFWWIALVAGFVLGLIVINKAQKKYNGTWIS